METTRKEPPKLSEGHCVRFFARGIAEEIATLPDRWEDREKLDKLIGQLQSCLDLAYGEGVLTFHNEMQQQMFAYPIPDVFNLVRNIRGDDPE